VDEKPLVLSADKTKIKADGSDEVTFTVKQDDVDVTDKVFICAADENGSCLMSNTFSSSTPGVYRFHAYFSADTELANHPYSNVVTITVEPVGGQTSGFDATRTLHKNVMFFFFTATWCGPCTTLKANTKTLMQTYGDNVVTLNCYSNDSNSKVNTSITETFISQFGKDSRFSMSAYPYTIVDLNMGFTGTIAVESLEYYYDTCMENPATTGIKVDSAISGGKVYATVAVGAQKAADYRIGVLLVEDNVVCYQINESDSYNHTSVLRAKAMDDIFGEELGTMEVGDTTSKDYTFDIAAGYNPENLYVVVYTVAIRYGRLCVSNSVKTPANGVTDFKYAD
jgi:thiol-disulfide isomerase/thioredoxin